jgi:hypothetical protein
MLTLTNFKCPNCNKEDHQKILFIGSEFSYKCIHCSAVHCFLENIFWDFTQNFTDNGCGSYKWKINRYIGTFDGEKWSGDELVALEMPGDYVSCSRTNAMLFFSKAISQNQEETRHTRVCSIKLSNKPKKDLVYIANAIHGNHFQDCLRAVIRMKEHILSPESMDSYNILILDSKTKFCLKPLNKMSGLDEIWYVDWSIKATWDWGMKNLDNISESLALTNSINRKLDEFSVQARAISKSSFPSIYGTQPIKDLFRIKDAFKLKNTINQVINKKYIAILIHPDNQNRSGFHSEKQIKDVCNIIKQFKLNVILLACTNFEEEIAKSVHGEEVLVAKKLEKQALFFQKYCIGVVGTNCSGCNLPCLYKIPLFTLAKKRYFPDDFYSMGRLLSTYDCNAAFFGDLSKPSSVTEIKIDENNPTNIEEYRPQLESWLKNNFLQD